MQPLKKAEIMLVVQIQFLHEMLRVYLNGFLQHINWIISYRT